MAQDQIKRGEIIQDGLFNETSKSAQELKTILDALKISFENVSKETGKIFNANKSMGSSKSVNDLTKALEMQEAVRKQVIKTQSIAENAAKKETKTTEKKVKQEKKLTDAQRKSLELEKVRGRETRKRLTAEAILNDKNSGTLEKLRAQNVLLRLERDKLNETDIKYQDNLKGLNDQIDNNTEKIRTSVDAFSQQKMNVGNYTESIKDALSQSGLFGGAIQKLTVIQGILSKSFKGIRADLQALKPAQTATTLATETDTVATTKNTVATRAMSAAKGKATKAVKLLGLALKFSGVGILLALTAGAVSFFKTFEEGQDGLARFTQQVGAFFGVLFSRLGKAFVGFVALLSAIKNDIQVFAKQIQLAFANLNNILGNNAAEVARLKKEISDLEKEAPSIKEALNKIGEAFKGMGAEVAETTERAGKLFDEIDAFGAVRRRIEIEIVKLQRQEQRLGMIANDTTLSFREREKAQIELAEASTKRANLELKLAQKELDFEIKKEAIKASVTAEAFKTALENQKATGTITEKAFERLLEFQKSVMQAQGEVATQAESNAQIARVNEQKSVLNSIKGIKQLSTVQLNNLRKIAEDTKMSFEDRLEAERQYEKHSEQATNAQIALAQKRTDKHIDLADLMDTKTEVELEQKIRGLDLDQKTEAQIAAIIAERLKELEILREIKQKRIEDQNEITKRNKVANSNIQTENQQFRVEELQRELNQGEATIAQQRKTSNELFDIRKSELIRIANFKIEQEGLTANEIKEIETKLDNDLRRLEWDRLSFNVGLDAKRIESNQRYLNTVTSQLKQSLQEQSQLREKNFQLEQQEQSRNIQIQSDRAAAGLKNTLAFQEAESKKAALVRKQELEKEQRRREALALSETYLNALNANLKANEPLGVANAKALATTFAARGIAKGLQFFNEGTEYVEQKGKKSPFSKGKDTVPAMLAVGEGVVKTDANINNPGVVAALNKGVFQDLYAPRKAVESSGNNFNASILLNEQLKTNQLLEKIASKPNQWISQDVLGQIVEKTYHKSHSETTTYKRSINPYKR